MDDMQTIVRELLTIKRLTHRGLAVLVPCSSSQIGMLATGARGSCTSYRIENRLRELHRQAGAAQ